jgi:hypothetical protein
MQSLVEYWKLCNIKPQAEQNQTALSKLDEHIILVLFTKEQRKNMLKEVAPGNYVLKQQIIGGSKTPKKIQII